MDTIHIAFCLYINTIKQYHTHTNTPKKNKISYTVVIPYPYLLDRQLGHPMLRGKTKNEAQSSLDRMPNPPAVRPERNTWSREAHESKQYPGRIHKYLEV